MPRKLCLAALLLLGVSCARLGQKWGQMMGRLTGRGNQTAGAGESAAARPAGEAVKDALLISETTHGALAIRKWRLGNGLDVVLMPDSAATSIAYMTWFRVGLRHENAEAGETGLAHLFEHLMFTQTRSAKAPGEFDRRMEQAGASTNAMTFYDFTAYIDQLPPGAVPLAVDLEADRMVNLALTDEQVRTERDVVAEERLGDVDDSVDGTLDEMMYGRAFQRHPYRYPVIGRMADIKAVTKDKATRFYRTFYAPNNAVVVVAGRFDAGEVLATIARGYGAIPPSPNLPTDSTTPERAPAQEIRLEIERPLPADRLALAFPSPPLADPDRAAFEVLNEILTGGPSARLHRRLVVESQIASSVDGGAASTKDPALFALWVQLRKGHPADEAERMINRELQAVIDRPVGEADLRKARNRIETSFWRGLASSEGRASQLGEFEVVAGDYRKLFSRAEEITRVTAADVQRVARAYLGGKGRVVAVARPKPTTGKRDAGSERVGRSAASPPRAAHRGGHGTL